jgi:outer membrane beta-barrel protein
MSRIAPSLLALLGLLWTATDAHAQETIDVGVLRDKDVKVVQRLLYPKNKRLEFGGTLGLMPFDAYTTTPVFAGNFGYHFSETLASELVLLGGLPFKNGTMKELESPAYGVAPDAYGFQGAVMADVQWAPIYAKMNLFGKKIVHHDVFMSTGIGLTFERSMLPDKTSAMSPTLGLGLGSRMFVGKGWAIRLHLRDDIIREYRLKTAETKAWFIKQNVSLNLGFSKFTGK